MADALPAITNLRHLALINQGLQQVTQVNDSLAARGITPAEWFASACGTAKPEEEEEEPEEDANAVTDAQQKTFLLRICVHSAEQLPREKAYVVTTIGEGDRERKDTTELSEESGQPVWEHCLDQDVTFSDRPPTVQFKIFGKRSLQLKDRLLGTASFRLPHSASEGPRRQLLKVSQPQDLIPSCAQCRPPQAPVLHVVWQLCESAAVDFRPDLNRVAEMDQTAVEKETHWVEAKVMGLFLRRHEAQKKVNVTLRLRRPDNDPLRQLATRSTPSALTWPKGEAYGKMQMGCQPPQAKDLFGCVEACWPSCDNSLEDLGWEIEPWTVRESQMMLLSYFLEVTVYETVRLEPEGPFRRGKDVEKPLKLGSWREPLGDLMDAIDQQDSRLRFDAELISRDSQNVGRLRLEVDVFTDQRHRQPPMEGRDMASAAIPSMSATVELSAAASLLTSIRLKVPIRRGMPAQDLWQQKVSYHCTVFADGLPNLERCHPYVKITITGAGGTSSVQTPVKTEHQVNNIGWMPSLLLTTRLINRKAKVELFNSNTQSNFLSNSLGLAPQGDLLGEATIYDVGVDKEYWLHMYGGALNAPKQDVAGSMVKGALRPPSTYQGSVVVHFGSRRQSQNYFQKILDQHEERRLVVRMYNGVNLRHYAQPGRKRRVKVLFQLAGCRLPDERELRRREQEVKRKSKGAEDPHEETTVCCGPGEEFGDLALDSRAVGERPDPTHFNRNLLSFPAEVDEMGVLRFKDTKCRQGNSWNSKVQPNCAWVERRTPRDFPLLVPPAVTHAYCYIVADGEEDRPPEVFGRFRLNEKEPSEVGPKWKRLRYDTSVIDTPESHFEVNIAGFLLGSVALISENRHDRFACNNKVPHVPAVLKDRSMTEIQQMLPRSTRGTFFPCCIADQQVSIGSLGEPDDVHCEPERPENRRRVYCHIDVLAARELPAMDDDGLIDPCYRIEVLDNEITQPGGMSKSMSPSFMHRVVIPLEMEVEEGSNPNTMVASTIPMPPVLVRILDFDEKRLFGQAVGGEFEEAGCVVVKHEPSKDGKFRMLGYDPGTVLWSGSDSGPEWIGGPPEQQPPLDLNSIHTPVWHALDKPANTRFDAAAGGVDVSWVQRPRLLLAVGYSMQRHVVEHAPRRLVRSPDYFKSSMRRDGEISVLQTEESACFQIDINLLGLRNLPNGIYNAKLLVSSFWQGAPVEFDIGGGFLGQHDHNPTFPQDGWEHVEENEGQASHKSYFSALLSWIDEPDLGLIYAEQEGEHSLLVIAVTANSAAGSWNESQGPEGWQIRPGDIILKVNGHNRDLQDQFVRGRKLEMLLVRGQAWRAFAHQVKDIVKVCHGQDAPLEEEEHSLPLVFLEELKGVKVQAPLYRVPVIPYLQHDHESVAMGASPSSTRTFGQPTLEDGPKEPFVLLPAVIFQLKNYVAGTDYGTMTVGLNRLNREAPFRTSWIDMVLKEYQTLPREVKTWHYKEKGEHQRGNIVPMKGLRIDEDAYSIFVDVFTAEPGYLTFDPDMRIGRPLSEQRLFSISKSRLTIDKEREVMQFFNPADFMAGNQAFAAEPFDSRVTPSLWCGKFDGEDNWDRRWLLPEAQVAQLCTPRRELRLNRPKGPNELLQDVFGGVIEKATNHSIRGSRPGERVKICNSRTSELRKELKSLGWRGTSHLVVPETDQEKNALFTDLVRSGGLSRTTLKANLHTFVRPVGHIIHDSDRDSHFLARLRMGLPMDYMAELKSRLQRDKEELEKYLASMQEATEGRELNEEEEELHRLQRSIEVNEARLQNAMRAERNTCNFMVVKFRKRGIVVWSAPDHVFAWPRPGVPIFVVQLSDRPDVKVPVFVPSFDIRYQFETTWTPVKTLLQRWRHMENRIRSTDKKGVRGGAPGPESLEKKRRRRKQQVPLAAQDLEDGNSDDTSGDEETDEEVTDPNGYSRAIAVSKYAFVCRIRRRRGAMCFDRPQTRNWYGVVFDDTFGQAVPRGRELVRTTTAGGASQEDPMKDVYLANFMNLEKPLATRLEQSGVATLKGHITCTRVKDPNPGKEAALGESGMTSRVSGKDYSRMTSRPLQLCTAPSQVEANTRAVENLWVQRRVFVDCCVLTGSDLELQSLGLSSCLKPYLVVKLGDETPGQSEPTEEVQRQGSSRANFYNTFVFETTLPGQAKMTIEVWHKGVLSNTLIGITEIDLEDRWLALKRRELRESSYEEYLRNCISPEKVRFCSFSPALASSGWVDPAAEPEADTYTPGRGKEPIKPARTASHRMPIEFRDLMRTDGETATESRAGVLRLWVDITPIGEHSPGDIEVFKPLEFQVRVVIWRINNISVFKDFGDRNDVYVKGRFKYVDFWGKEQVKVEKTDVHKFANAEAYFNWRWNFSVRAPSTDCFLELTMMDEDRISQHDTIYYPVVYSLDQMLNVAYTNAREGRRPLGTLQDTVIFDQFDEENAVENCCARYCRRCWRRARMRERRFARMRMDVQILPMEEAQSSPAEPGAIMPPKDRMTISTAISNPERTLQIIMGARNYYNVTYFSLFCFVLILLLLIAALCYFLLNIGTLFKSGSG